MGVTCCLIPIEHDLLVVRAPAAIAAEDLGPLRALVAELGARPREVDEAAVAMRRLRVQKLEEMNAPPVIVANERRFLAVALGEGRQVDPAGMDRDALVAHLVQWGRHLVTDLDKSWDLIHWWCDPARRRRRARDVGSARESVFDRMLFGQADAPELLAMGEGEAGYNPPEVVVELARAAEEVDVDAWSLDIFEGVPKKDLPYLASQGVDAELLEYARESFARLRAAYDRARKLGLGMVASCG